MRKQILILSIFLFVFANAAMAQKMTVKDSDSNVLMEVNDEGNVGSIMLPDANAAPHSTTNKLYNLSGTLYLNGSALTTTANNPWQRSGTFVRSEEHTSELQSHSFISYAVFCLKKKNK